MGNIPTPNRRTETVVSPAHKELDEVQQGGQEPSARGAASGESTSKSGIATLKIARAERQKHEKKTKRNEDEDDEYLGLYAVCRKGVRELSRHGPEARMVVMNKEAVAWARHNPNYINKELADNLMQLLVLDENWEGHRARMTVSLGVEGLRYTYDHYENIAQKWPEPIRMLEEDIKKAEGLSEDFNFALVNWYEDGKPHLDGTLTMNPTSRGIR